MEIATALISNTACQSLLSVPCKRSATNPENSVPRKGYALYLCMATFTGERLTKLKSIWYSFCFTVE